MEQNLILNIILCSLLWFYAFLMQYISYNKGFQRRKVETFTKELSAYFPRLFFLTLGSWKRLREKLVMDYQAQFEQYDLVLSPVLAQPVAKLGHFGTDVPVVAMIMRMNNTVNFTIIQNTTGAPAISLPMGFCRNGLPIGAMFGAKIGDERTLLEIGFELENAGGFEM